MVSEREPPRLRAGRLLGLVWRGVLLAASALFALSSLDLVASAILVAVFHADFLSPPWHLFQRPLGLALCSGAFLVLWRRRGAEPGRLANALVGTALVATVVAAMVSGAGVLQASLVAAVLALGASLAVGARLAWLQRPRGQAWFVVVAACGLAVANPDTGVPRTNRLGLVSFEPDQTLVETYAGQTSKDSYPTCTFAYNSLGYRDVEPPPEGVAPRRKRVLLIGDSFVWGDGIANGDDTLGARLRAALEQRAPGRWQVVAAAFPGNGVYGYTRAIEALLAVCPADVVVVGFLGERAELDRLDAQRISELASAVGPLRGLLGMFGAFQALHEGSGRAREAWTAPDNLAWGRARLEHAVANARERGARVLFLDYGGEAEHSRLYPADAAVFPLPADLRYPGERNPYWFALDNHPKPLFNQTIAPLLAARLEALPASPR